MYPKNFEKAFNELIMVEGGYVNHPMDPGGETKYGITKATASQYGIDDIKNLTLDQAKEIYYKKFWLPYKFDLIRNSKISGEMFEFTVNTGSGRLAIKILQRSYNLLNKNYLIDEDGVIGPITARAVNNYKFYKSLYKTMNIYQGLYYISLAEEDDILKTNIKEHQTVEGSKVYKTFIRGWIDKRVNI